MVPPSGDVVMRYVAIVSVVLLGAMGSAALGGEDDDTWDGWDAWRKGGAKIDEISPGRFRRGGFSDEAVKRAIKKGCDFLWSMRGGDGSLPPRRGGGNQQYPTGTTAIAAYALLASGVSPLDKRMAQTLKWLEKTDTTKTYDLGLRCNVWHLANKETGGKYTGVFKKDLQKLLKSTASGAYNYDCNSDGRSHGDHSNSQYGVLGTWAGAMARMELPDQYWHLVLDHWKRAQNSDGGWAYREGSSTATMTAAGVATLFVCYENLFADKFIRCDVGQRGDKPIRDGLKWLDENFDASLGGMQGGLMGHGDLHYYLYGVERVGLASGFKYFGKHDWYKLGATRLLALQSGDGSWRGKYSSHVDTAFALLFLVRGQHAVAFNKLEHDAFDWNNRPRDLAGLTRWATNSFERQMNWQIISMKAPVEEWHDAPILYVSGALDPNMDDRHVEKLRTFVWQGGTLLTVTECNGRGFQAGIRKVYKRMFPDYELKRVPRDHDLYAIHHRLYGRPPLYVISNGIRPLAIHTDADLAKSWQLEMKQTAAGDFQTAANILMYVTDKGLLRHRGASHWPPKPQRHCARTIRVARIRYNGSWDPEPLAYERFRRLMAYGTGTKIDVVSPVAISALAADDPNVPPVATMTGTRTFLLPASDRAALKKYIESGGTLIVDAAGGSREFGASAEMMLRGMFGRRAVRRLAQNAAVFHLPKMKIESVKYRRKARVERGLKGHANLRGVELKGRLAVLFSKEDLTGGLVGYESSNCVDYHPESCFELMRNAVIYGASGDRKTAGGSAVSARR